MRPYLFFAADKNSSMLAQPDAGVIRLSSCHGEALGPLVGQVSVPVDRRNGLNMFHLCIITSSSQPPPGRRGSRGPGQKAINLTLCRSIYMTSAIPSPRLFEDIVP